MAKAKDAAALSILEAEGRIETLKEKLAWGFEDACELQREVTELSDRLVEMDLLREDRYQLAIRCRIPIAQAEKAQGDLAAALGTIALSKPAKRAARGVASSETQKRLSDLQRNAKKRSKRRQVDIS